MPYINEEDQHALDPVVPILEGRRRAATTGELCFQISRLLDDYAGPSPDYQRLSEAEHAALSAALEFRRRVIDPYEDQRRALNGDVFMPRRPIGRVR